MPREAHLLQLFHIFAYLRINHNARSVFDPTYPTIDRETFAKQNWDGLYREGGELIPDNIPKP